MTPKDDLIAAMAAPAGSLALPKLRQPREEKPAEPAPAPEPEPVREAPRPPRQRKASPKPVGRPATGRITKGIGINAPLIDPMKANAAEAKQTLGEWLMAALDRQWDALEEVYPPLPKRRPELPPAYREPRREVPGGRISQNFRLTLDQLAALDARKDALSVESRSEFVSAVVGLDLGMEF